jgi:hypothetical protein
MQSKYGDLAPATHPPSLHEAEVALQQKMGVPAQVTSSMPWSMPMMSDGDRRFFTQLPFIVVATLDVDDRPWVSVITQRPHAAGGVASVVPTLSSPNAHTLLLDADVSFHDPLFTNMRDTRAAADAGDKPMKQLQLFAGVGVDPSNRRRNKISGVFTRKSASVDVSNDDDGVGEGRARVRATLVANEVMGNCPKYITLRKVDVVARVAVLESAADALHSAPVTVTAPVAPDPDEGGGVDGNGAGGPTVALDDAAAAVVRGCDTVFIGTRHLTETAGGSGETLSAASASSMDCNHRGGGSGFVRVGTEKRTLVFPDFSGNRIFSSMGNVESDGVCGITAVDFTTGDVLYVTGRAELLLGARAKEVMTASACVCRIHVTAFRLVRAGVNLATVGDGAQPSPYSPPVFPLVDELPAGRALAMDDVGDGDDKARDVEVLTARLLTPTVANFQFRLPHAIHYRPGQFVVLDWTADMKPSYARKSSATSSFVCAAPLPTSCIDSSTICVAFF